MTILTAQQVYAMLGSQPVWETAHRCGEIFTRAAIPHALVGGLAVCLHGYQRNTVDVDILVRREDTQAVRDALEKGDFRWSAETAEFRMPDGVPVHFLLANEQAGDDSSLGVVLPDPDLPGASTEIEGLRVLTLGRLIETKIACGLGSIRRTHRDFADVVELISVHRLSRAFARHLHKSVRKTFRELVLRARGES
jgi:hypothetical protein